MKKNMKLSMMLLGAILTLSGCTPAASTNTTGGKLNIVATTTMIADITRVIGGDDVEVNGLMGPGIDPHLYQASAGDVTLMQKADVVIYNGLHLEGKMGEIFESLSSQGSAVICIEDGIDRRVLLISADDENVYDPHIWFDVSIWKSASEIVAQGLIDIDPDNEQAYKGNLENYLKELDELDKYIKDRVAELPEGQRVLVTAHDAFSYFGNAYGFEVKGLQGISTEAEAGTGDVSSLAAFIADRQIKAIFIESSVPPKTIEALRDAVKAKGFDVSIGGELYSDALGDEDSGAETYILTFKSNVDTIVDSLK